jgi:hypothetical protein
LWNVPTSLVIEPALNPQPELLMVLLKNTGHEHDVVLREGVIRVDDDGRAAVDAVDAGRARSGDIGRTRGQTGSAGNRWSGTWFVSIGETICHGRIMCIQLTRGIIVDLVTSIVAVALAVGFVAIGFIA